MLDGTWFEPGETKEIDSDISEDELSIHFKLEEDNTSSETVEASTEVEDENDDEDDEEESSKSEENNENVGD